MTLALHGKSKRRQMGLLTAALMAVVLAAVGGVLWMGVAGAVPSSVTGAVNTSTSAGTVQNGNTKYTNKCDVYLRAAQQGNSNLGPDGTWYIKVTDPSGATLLTPNPPGYITATVSGGKFVSYKDFGGTSHTATNDVVPLCAVGTYSDTPNSGGEYKAWASISTGFADSDSKTDNFKVKLADPTISKSQSQVSQDPTSFYWSISVNNPAAADQTVRVSDTGATFVAQTSPNPASGTCTGLGVDCTVKAKQTLVIGVSKLKPAATCSPQTMSNTATLSVVDGQTVTQLTSSKATPDYIVAASTGEQCSSQGTLTVRKVGNFSAGVVAGGFSGPISGPSAYSSTWSADVGGQDSKTVTAGTGYAVSETTTGFPLNVTDGTVNGAQYKVLASPTEECGTSGFTASAPSNLTVTTGAETVVCVQNTFSDTQEIRGSVIVKKEYVLNGGTKVVPVVHVEDLNDPTPAIDGNGLNDATHSQWEPVPVDTSGLVSVWEDLPAGWTTSGPPTISGCQIPDHSFLVQASENLVFVPPADANTAVQVLVDPEGICTVTFHNEQIAQTRTIRIGKVTTTATHPQEFFTGTIAPGTPGTFSVNLPANQSAGPITDYVMANQNGQVVTETNVPANWTVNGYTVKADANGKGSCSTTESYSGTSANVPSGSGTYLVCIRNTYTPPPTTTPTPFNPCAFGCAPLILNTPTPTVVPPTPTVVPPTPTVAPPTATPTKAPVEEVEGAKTPGAIATPLAPSTGSGLGDGGSSTNLFIALIGIFSLSGGLALLGYGRKRR